MSPILTTRLKNHIDSDLKEIMYTKDCADDAQVYSRGLVGICLASLSGRVYGEVVNNITDGVKDNGIDGVLVDSARNKIFIVQSKWSSKGTGTIDTGDLKKFFHGVYDLLNEEWKKFNPRFSALSAEISAGVRADPEIVLVVAYNSDNPISQECQALVNDFLNENNSDGQELVTFQSFRLKHLVRTVRTVKSGTKTDVELNLLQWGEHKDPYYSLYGKVSCADIAEWYRSHDELLFSENIRGALQESDINVQIENALLTSPADFWYLNNGITAISDQVSRKPLGLGDQKDSSYWNISNIKIVNGAQTTSSIARAYAKKPNVVKKAYVQLKVISLDDAPIDISNRITTATNTQNKVEPRDFLALDALQEGLSESFKKSGIQYCYRRGERVIDISQGLDVQELAMTLAVTGESISNVVLAKRNAGSLTDPNGNYSKIFDKPIVPSEIWKSVLRLRKASHQLSTFAQTLSGRDAQLAVHGNRFLEHLLVRSSERSFTPIVLRRYHALLSGAIAKNFSDCYLAVLFKNAKKCQLLETEVLRKIASAKK